MTRGPPPFGTTAVACDAKRLFFSPAGGEAGSALSARLARLETLTRAAPAALHARSGAARADAAARALLVELHEIYEWLDAPALKDLDSLSEVRRNAVVA